MTKNVISTYLQDHHAGSAAGVDAFRRIAENHADDQVRATVARIGEDVATDQIALERIMDSLGVKPSPIKDIPARVGEKVARLKPNERIAQRSPLSDILELEALVMAVHGKSLGWRMLLHLDDERLDNELLNELLQRANAQLDELEKLRLSEADKLTWN